MCTGCTTSVFVYSLAIKLKQLDSVEYLLTVGGQAEMRTFVFQKRRSMDPFSAQRRWSFIALSKVFGEDNFLTENECLFLEA